MFPTNFKAGKKEEEKRVGTPPISLDVSIMRRRTDDSPVNKRNRPNPFVSVGHTNDRGR